MMITGAALVVPAAGFAVLLGGLVRSFSSGGWCIDNCEEETSSEPRGRVVASCSPARCSPRAAWWPRLRRGAQLAMARVEE